MMHRPDFMEKNKSQDKEQIVSQNDSHSNLKIERQNKMSNEKLNEMQNEIQNDFMIEKIKERPVNKRKLLRRTLITASMAVIFGLIACFTFLVLEPVINNWLYPEAPPQLVVFPEDQEEMSPEEMLSDNMQQENQANQEAENSEEVELEKEQIQEILGDIVLSKENYAQVCSAMSGYAEELEEYMVTVTGVSSNVDWFNNVEISKKQSYGAIIADNGRELLILADYLPLKSAESLTLTFHNGVRLDAEVKGLDLTTNLAILSVSQESLEKEMYVNSLKIAPLGSSNAKDLVGSPVVALGSPMGIGGSVGYGVVTAVGNKQSQADTNYRFMQTDINGSKSATGFLFNMNGQIIGVITNAKVNDDMQNMITAYGITDLKKRIEKMSNGQKMAYLGIKGVDVTKEANAELNVPYGAYVTEVEMDSPSMLAGIQQGDILVSIDDTAIFTYGEYIMLLGRMEPGESVDVIVMRLGQDEYKEMKFEIVPE